MKAVGGGTTTNLVYDPLGRLFETNQGSSATTTRFLTDGDAMVSEHNSSNAVTNRYVHGSNAAADDPLVWYTGSTLTTKRWLHADHLGSIVAVTNSSGGSPTLNKYDEYGVPASTNSGRFQYTGQAWIGELGLYYYKARFYSPGLGRFLQTDPVGYEGGINLYAYVEGDPVNGADPSGTVCITGPLGNAGTKPCLRSIYYARIASDPKISSRTTFFSAASAVVNALASAELTASGASEATRDFLEDSGERLAAANILRATQIANGTLYGGTSVAQNDRDFVRFEQRFMQDMLNSFQQRDPSGYANSISEINGLLNGGFREGIGALFGVSDKNVRAAIDYVRSTLGRPIDFSKMSDRVAIGDRLTSMLRAGATLCIGTRLRVC